MSIESTLARVSAIRQAVADPSALIGSQGASTGGTQAPPAGGGSSTFASALAQASAGTPASASLAAGLANSSASMTAAQPGAAVGVGYPSAPSGVQGIAGVPQLSGPETPGGRIVAVAESQLGQAEQPPGSNEGAAIAQYRTATAGAMPGEPWCAYFASWAARQAGEPIGAQGQGLGSVSEIWSWAQSAGRAVANGPGVVPKPGDLIVFGGEHVGIVRAVLPNGQISTIEGNYENKVSANTRGPGEATGYVSMS